MADKALSREALKFLLLDAHAAGMAAGNAATPPVMIVERHESVLDDASPVAQRWVVPEGPCGFAWVTVRPGNSRAASVLREVFDGSFGGRASPDRYAGGMMLWIHEFGQSMARKDAYARAFAERLRSANIRAFAGSRMD